MVLLWRHASHLELQYSSDGSSFRRIFLQLSANLLSCSATVIDAIENSTQLIINFESFQTHDVGSTMEETEGSESIFSETESVLSQTESLEGENSMNAPQRLAPKSKRVKDATDLRIDKALQLIEKRQKIIDDEEETFGKWVGQSLRNTADPFIKLWMQEQITNVVQQGKRKTLSKMLSSVPVTRPASAPTFQTSNSKNSEPSNASMACLTEEDEESISDYDLYEVVDD